MSEYYLLPGTNQQKLTFNIPVIPVNRIVTEITQEDYIPQNTDEMFLAGVGYSGLYSGGINVVDSGPFEGQSNSGFYLISTQESYPDNSTSVQNAVVTQRNYLSGSNKCDSLGKQHPNCSPLGNANPINQKPGLGPDSYSCMLTTLLAMISAELGNIGIDINDLLQCDEYQNEPLLPGNPLFDQRNNALKILTERIKSRLPNEHLKKSFQHLIDYGQPLNAIDVSNPDFQAAIKAYQDAVDALRKVYNALNFFLKNNGKEIKLPVTCEKNCLQEVDKNTPCEEFPCFITLRVGLKRGGTGPGNPGDMLKQICSGKPIPVRVNQNYIEQFFKAYVDNNYTWPDTPDGWPPIIGDWPRGVPPNAQPDHMMVITDIECIDNVLYVYIQDSYTYPNGKIRSIVIPIDLTKNGALQEAFGGFSYGVPLGRNNNIVGVKVTGPEPSVEQACLTCDDTIIDCNLTPTPSGSTPTPSASSPSSTPTPSTSGPSPTPSSTSGGSAPTPSVSTY